MNPLIKQIRDSLSTKGFTIKNGDSQKIIKNFENSKFSDLLWDFFRIHPSNRVLFNSIVKTGNPLINPQDLQEKLNNLYKYAKTSSIYYAKCRCGALLDRPNIIENSYSLPQDKEIYCTSCGVKHNLIENNYFPLHSITVTDIIKLLNKLKASKIFSQILYLQCIYCTHPNETVSDSHNIDIECPNCKNNRILNQNFINIGCHDLIKDKQGYWLEWYAWRQLESYNAVNSKKFSEIETKFEFEVDVCFVYNDELILIECKDTTDLRDSLVNLHLINKIASKYFLITTMDINPKHISQFRTDLGDKFIHISSKDVDNILKIVQTSL